MSVLPSLRYTLRGFLPQVFDDRDNYIDDVTDADLYKCVELNCELPGAGQLQVRTGRTAVVVIVIVVVALVAYVLMVLLLFVYSSVCVFLFQVNLMDYDDITGDELIGRTVIDLEDRWFDQRWQVRFHLLRSKL